MKGLGYNRWYSLQMLGFGMIIPLKKMSAFLKLVAWLTVAFTNSAVSTTLLSLDLAINNTARFYGDFDMLDKVTSVSPESDLAVSIILLCFDLTLQSLTLSSGNNTGVIYWMIANLSDNEWIYQIPNFSDTELFRYQTYQHGCAPYSSKR